MINKVNMNKRRYNSDDVIDSIPVKRRRSSRIQDISRRKLEYVSASQTRNYILHDPLLDWFNMYKNKKRDGMLNFLFSQGNLFEKRLITYLYNTIGTDLFVDIQACKDPRSPQKISETLEAMNTGKPFIYNGVIFDDDRKTFGIPDLIVRSDYIHKLVKLSPINDNEINISAPHLIDKDNKPPKYHYRIIDIKFSTLHLRTDGIHLLNTASMPAFKSQLEIYTRALGKIQGYDSGIAYVLGRKWEYMIKGVKMYGTNALDRLGTINFNTIDYEYAERTDNAIEWIRTCKRDGYKWIDIVNHAKDNTRLHPNLYPNMSNYLDSPWRDEKKKLADSIGEITDLWRCGVKQREIAHHKGIFSWRDPRCLSDNLNIGEGSLVTLNSILTTNRGDNYFNIPSGTYLPEQLKSDKFVVYIDFEMINSIVDDLKTIPESGGCDCVFLIGSACVGIDGVLQSHQFLSPTLDKDGENTAFENFGMWLEEECKIRKNMKPVLVHWSHAETTSWDNMIDSHRLTYNKFATEFEWFDLLGFFRNTPITVKGSLGFGLKSIAGSLAKHDIISSKWCNNLDGITTLLGASSAYRDAKLKDIAIEETHIMKDILNYNSIDVKVLYEMVEWLRGELD